MKYRIVSLRIALIGWAAIVAISRLGVTGSIEAHYMSDRVYGVAFMAAAIWLAATLRNGSRHGWIGRLAAVYAAALFAGLGVDVLPATTSALFLWWCAALALGEAVTWNEC